MRQKWYNKWWAWTIIILLLFIGYITFKESTAYFNFVELQKLQIKEYERKDKIQDSLIILKDKEIEDLKLKKAKINTSDQTFLINQLKKELEALRKVKITKDTLSPDELNIFLQKLLK